MKGAGLEIFLTKLEVFHRKNLYCELRVISELQIQGEEMPTKYIFEATISCYIANEGNCMFILSKDKSMEQAHEN